MNAKQFCFVVGMACIVYVVFIAMISYFIYVNTPTRFLSYWNAFLETLRILGTASLVVLGIVAIFTALMILLLYGYDRLETKKK